MGLAGDQPATSQTSPLHEPWSSPARSFSSNQTRRGGRLFHENCVTRAGRAQKLQAKRGAASSKDTAPGQNRAGRMPTVTLTNDLDGSVYT
jgi:hypothetical protein